MNRLGILLATVCAALAVLIAALSGVRAGHAPIAKPGTVKVATPHPGLKKASAQEPDDDDSVIRFAKNPSPIPLFLARDLDGDIISTASLKGKVVIVNFWATWCPPCREEIPNLVKLQNDYKDQLQIIGISEDEVPEDVLKNFARSIHINYPIVMNSTELEKDFGGVPALPTSFIVNKDGGVVQKHVGLYPPEVYEREVRALLGMQVDAKIETFEDTGQIFLKNAENATELPGVDMSGLDAKQKQIALKRMNSEFCTCGCKLTLAQCRINDSECATSKQLTAKIVKEVAAGKTAPALPVPQPDSQSE
ncbi:MAG: TlpA disulfide reductase family protein [Candidatus Acidiferrales bacterium]